MAEPDVLVVIPSLGQRPEMLKEALETCKQLANLIPTRTVVVLPRKATKARELAGKLGAEVLDDPEAGMAEATNRAIATRGSERYFIWLGDDDRLVPGGVAELVRALESSETAPAAYGHCDYIDASGAVGVTNRAGHLAPLLLAWGPNLIPHPGTVIRLDALEKVGLYAPHLSFALDLDVFFSLRTLGKFLYRPVTSAQFRWHPSSLTVANRRDSTKEAVRVRLAHLPPLLRPLGRLWFPLLAIATSIASRRVTARFARLRQNA